jgi:hypothetical protein
LATTGQSKLAFVGHSEGATTMLTSLTTERAEWFKDRISIFVAIASVSRMDHMKSTLLRVLGSSSIPFNIIKSLGIKEWFDPNILWTTLFNHICNYVIQICEFNMMTISDGKPSVNDRDAFRIYMGHFPGGLSVKTLDHELQMYNAEKFQYYDYGTEGNMEKYGTKTPPEIALENINDFTIAMMVGDSDLIGDVIDNEWLRDKLGRNVVFYKVYDYGNSSFYVAKQIEEYLEDLVGLLKKYTSSSFLKTKVND